MKTTKILSLLLTLLLCFAVFVGCAEAPTGVWESATYTEDKTLGEGDTTLTLTVTAEEKSVVFTVKTNAENVKDALYSVGIIAGEQQAVGFMISHVNGMRADWNQDHAYWAFYDANGDYMMTGVDSTPITDDCAYAFVYTPAS